MKKNVWALMILALVVLVAGCGKKKTEQEPTPTESGSPAVITGGENTPGAYIGSVTVYPTEYPTTNCITWVNPWMNDVSKENCREINRILYEKGYDCQIQFVKTDTVMGTEYAQWVERIEKSMPLDILYTSAWNFTEQDAQRRFVDTKLVTLNEYLESEDGKALYEAYTDEEWKSVTQDGIIRVIPKAFVGAFEEYRIDNGTRLFVHPDYVKYFDIFDGTYASLKAIYNTIDNSNLRIGIRDLNSGDILFGLLGYDNFAALCLPYSEGSKTVMNPVKSGDIPNLLLEMYNDLKSGMLVNLQYEKKTPEGMIAVIGDSSFKAPEGYREYLISRRVWEYNAKGKYGISVNSTQKELAFRILTVCYTDSDILTCMFPGVDRDTIELRKEIMSALPKSDITGIRMEQADAVNGREQEKGNSLMNAFNVLENTLYVLSDPDDYNSGKILNPEWDVNTVWKEFKNSTGYIDELCEAANRDIANYLAGTGR